MTRHGLMTAAGLALVVGFALGTATAQQGAPQAPAANLPAQPTAVALPTLSAEVTGPGPMFDSAPSHAPGNLFFGDQYPRDFGEERAG